MSYNMRTSLEIINNESRPNSLRHFRSSVYKKTDLSYGKTIRAVAELVSENKLIRLHPKSYKFKTSINTKKQTLAESIAELSKNPLLGSELKELKQLSQTTSDDRYHELKKLIHIAINSYLKNSVNFSFDISNPKVLFLKRLPYFFTNTDPDFFYQKSALIDSDYVFDVKALTDLCTRSLHKDGAMLLGYPLFYAGDKKEIIPVFFRIIDKAVCGDLSIKLNCLNDEFFLNPVFFKEVFDDISESDKAKFAALLSSKDFGCGASLSGFRIKEGRGDFSSAMEKLKLFIPNVLTKGFDGDSLEQCSQDNVAADPFINSAVLCSFMHGNDEGYYAGEDKISQLRDLLEIENDVLDTTSLSIFSTAYADNVHDSEDRKSFLNDCIIGDDYAFHERTDISELPALRAAVSCKGCTVIGLNSGADTSLLVSDVIKNLYFSGETNAVVSNKTVSNSHYRNILEKVILQDINLSGEAFPIRCSRIIKRVNEHLSEIIKESVSDEFLKQNLDEINLKHELKTVLSAKLMLTDLVNKSIEDIKASKRFALVASVDCSKLSEDDIASLREKTRRLLVNLYSGHDVNNLTAKDLLLYRLKNRFFLGNSLFKKLGLKKPETPSQLKDFIEKIELLDKYLDLLSTKNTLRIEFESFCKENNLDPSDDSNLEKLDMRCEELICHIAEKCHTLDPKLGAAWFRSMSFHTDYDPKLMQTGNEEDGAAANISSDIALLKDSLRHTIPVSTFNSAGEFCSLPLIPGVFDNFFVDDIQTLPLYDLLLILASARRVVFTDIALKGSGRKENISMDAESTSDSGSACGKSAGDEKGDDDPFTTAKILDAIAGCGDDSLNVYDLRHCVDNAGSCKRQDAACEAVTAFKNCSPADSVASKHGVLSDSFSALCSHSALHPVIAHKLFLSQGQELVAFDSVDPDSDLLRQESGYRGILIGDNLRQKLCNSGDLSSAELHFVKSVLEKDYSIYDFIDSHYDFSLRDYARELAEDFLRLNTMTDCGGSDHKVCSEND